MKIMLKSSFWIFIMLVIVVAIVWLQFLNTSPNNEQTSPSFKLTPTVQQQIKQTQIGNKQLTPFPNHIITLFSQTDFGSDTKVNPDNSKAIEPEPTKNCIPSITEAELAALRNNLVEALLIGKNARKLYYAFKATMPEHEFTFRIWMDSDFHRLKFGPIDESKMTLSDLKSKHYQDGHSITDNNTLSIDDITDALENNTIAPNSINNGSSAIYNYLFTQNEFEFLKTASNDTLMQVRDRFTAQSVPQTTGDLAGFLLLSLRFSSFTPSAIVERAKILFRDIDLSDADFVGSYSGLSGAIAKLSSRDLIEFLHQKGMNFHEHTRLDFNVADRLIHETIYQSGRKDLDQKYEALKYLLELGVYPSYTETRSKYEHQEYAGDKQGKFFDLVRSIPLEDYQHYQLPDDFLANELTDYQHALKLTPEYMQAYKQRKEKGLACHNLWLKEMKAWQKKHGKGYAQQERQKVELMQKRIQALDAMRIWVKENQEKGVGIREIDIYLSQIDTLFLIAHWNLYASIHSPQDLRDASKKIQRLGNGSIANGLIAGLKNNQLTQNELKALQKTLIIYALKNNLPDIINHLFTYAKNHKMYEKDLYQDWYFILANLLQAKAPLPNITFLNAIKDSVDFSWLDAKNNNLLMYSAIDGIQHNDFSLLTMLLKDNHVLAQYLNPPDIQLIFGKDINQKPASFDTKVRTLNLLDYLLTHYTPDEKKIVELVVQSGHPVDELHRSLLEKIAKDFPKETPNI